MNDHIRLVWKKLDHLSRMRSYLAYSHGHVVRLLPIVDLDRLKPENHESLAAFRVRFSEYQEHLGKAMRAVAIEEEQKTEPFSAVLLYMEKLGILDSVERWKEIRELRNAINHEYEEDANRLSELFSESSKAAPELFRYHDRLTEFCESNYRAAEDTR